MAEPVGDEGASRNDLRIDGSRQSGLGNKDFDLTIVSLSSQASPSTNLPPTGSTERLQAQRTEEIIQKHLDSVARFKTRHQPSPSVPFQSPVFSLGGMMEKSISDEFRRWKGCMTGSVHGFLIKHLSLGLLRARVHSFSL